MKEAENLEIRSEEVQEILGTPPGWMVQRGTVLALITVVILGWSGYWIRYPEVIETKIEIMSAEPAQKLYAPSGRSYISHILLESGDTVNTNQVLVVFRNQGKFEDVLTLENRLLRVKVLNDSALLSFEPPDDLLLGDLLDDLYSFMQKQEALRQTYSPKKSMQQLQRQYREARATIELLRRQRSNLAEQLDLVNQRLMRDEILFKENALTYNALRKTREEILALEREMQKLDSNIKSNEFEMQAIRRQINSLREGPREGLLSASTELKESFYNLMNSVEDWKKRHLIVSPIEGVAYISSNNVSEQQFVSEGTELVRVFPLAQTDTIGQILLDITGSGKVHEGQRVIVKLQSHPFHQYGALVGIIEKKGQIPTGDKIPIRVRFPDGLTTNTGQEIELSQEMKGTAEIITEDKRFIERIFENIRRVAS